MVWSGCAIYALVFLVWSALLAYGLAEGNAGHLIGLGSLAFISYIYSRAHVRTAEERMQYAVTWFFTVAALDALLALPFVGPELFSDPFLWVGYSIVFMMPFISFHLHTQEIHSLSSRT